MPQIPIVLTKVYYFFLNKMHCMPLANFQSPKMVVLEKFTDYIIALWEKIY